MKKKFRFKITHNNKELSEPDKCEVENIKIIRDTDEVAMICKAVSDNQFAFLKKEK